MAPKQLKFIGRESQLADLERYFNKPTANFIVMTGRRRVGKSRLIREFCKNIKTYMFSGLPPSKSIDSQIQRDFFATQLAEQTGLPEFKSDDWHKLFSLLGRETASGKTVIVLDEISWMAAGDITFLAKLKVAWDNLYSQNPNLMLIVCGSVSTWIDQNILSSTGYFGRISQKIFLEPFTLKESNQMLEVIGFKRSAYEKFQILSVTGNIPWYIEQVDPKYDATENIKQLCFRAGSLFVKEYDEIFHDLFESRGEIYKVITQSLASGPISFDELCTALNYANSGTMSEYVNDLIQAGFIQKDLNWDVKSGKTARLHRLRLSDNYLRFYLKCIFPRMHKIEQDLYAETELDHIAGWHSIMGLQFENLILNNRKSILKLLHVSPEKLVQSGPYFQRKTTRQQGCQIDYLIQTLHNTFFVCEIKFSQNPIKSIVISEVKQKIKALSFPQNSACLPVLIHVNDVEPSVVDAEYFAEIIDLKTLF